MQNDFNLANNVGQTRAAMGGFLGEIVTKVLGDNSIQKLFEDAGKHPDEYVGKPTGDIIGLLKGTSPELVNALLVAQAAERACAKAEHAAGLAGDDGRNIALQYKLDETLAFNPQTYGFIPEDHKDFSYIGRDGDPDVLKKAQATMLAAQLYLNNEVQAIADNIARPDDVGKTQSLGPAYLDSFRAAASYYYAQAAEVLNKHGLTDVAENLSQVSQHIAGKITASTLVSPAICTKALLLQKNLAFSLASNVDPASAKLPADSLVEAGYKIMGILGLNNQSPPALAAKK